MPQRMLVLALFLASYPGSPLDAQTMEIESFDVSILLDPDGTFYVTETIDVDFGNVEKHGIFRTIPVDYSRDQTIAGASIATRYAIRLWLLGVADGRGAPRRYATWYQGESIYVRIGDPDRTISGRQTYAITYRVQRAINRFETHDELYWNVTGTEWDWPIHRASVRVTVPADVPSARLQHKTFTGPRGSTGTTAVEQVRENTYEASAENLGPGEGLTIVLGLPKGSLELPSAWREFWWTVADNIGFFLVALVPVAAFVGMFILYVRVGRDPGHDDPIVVQYSPPAELSPAEVGALVDERIDVPDIVSTVIDLAVRGYLKISEEKTTVFLFLSQRDYRFEKMRSTDGDLSSHEKMFFEQLFSGADSVLLSSLKNRFYQYIPGIRHHITRQMLQKKLFPRDPEHVRFLFRAASFLAVAVPVGIGIFLVQSERMKAILVPPDPTSLAHFALLSLALTWVVVFLFARVMPVKTPKGAMLARQCLGFKEFVSRVEKDRIARMAQDDPTVFERLLPYAVVLGVADEWAARFEGLLSEPPDWYGSMSSGSFRAGDLVTSLGHSMQSMGSTLTSQPSRSGGGGGGSSSAGGGFSGFSGGGGSSGGGFGGGGGGSW